MARVGRLEGPEIALIRTKPGNQYQLFPKIYILPTILRHNLIFWWRDGDICWTLFFPDVPQQKSMLEHSGERLAYFELVIHSVKHLESVTRE